MSSQAEGKNHFNCFQKFIGLDRYLLIEKYSTEVNVSCSYFLLSFTHQLLHYSLHLNCICIPPKSEQKLTCGTVKVQTVLFSITFTETQQQWHVHTGKSLEQNRSRLAALCLDRLVRAKAFLPNQLLSAHEGIQYQDTLFGQSEVVLVFSVNQCSSSWFKVVVMLCTLCTVHLTKCILEYDPAVVWFPYPYSSIQI